MASIRTGFELTYEQISPDPTLGEAAVIPWDSAIFGFPVATFRPGVGEFSRERLELFRSTITKWLDTRNISVCSSFLAPTDSFWRQVLPRAGFEFVDLSLQVSVPLASAKLPPLRTPVRPALPQDHAAIETIASESFSHGRYHADPRFPKLLADRRYSQWVRNALHNPSEFDRIYVLELGGRVEGFHHVVVDGELSDLRLAAVAANLKGTMLGVELYSATLHELRRQNVRRAVGSISATNHSVVNLFSILGFRFSSPEIVYHWHASGWGLR